jgi:hypothetical protein
MGPEISDDPKSSSVVYVGVVGTLVVLIIVILLEALFYHQEYQQEVVKNLDVQFEGLVTRRAQQQERLVAPPRWIDRDKGIVQIPIDRAMELVIKEYGGDSRGKTGG